MGPAAKKVTLACAWAFSLARWFRPYSSGRENAVDDNTPVGVTFENGEAADELIWAGVTKNTALAAIPHTLGRVSVAWRRSPWSASPAGTYVRRGDPRHVGRSSLRLGDGSGIAA